MLVFMNKQNYFRLLKGRKLDQMIKNLERKEK